VVEGLLRQLTLWLHLTLVKTDVGFIYDVQRGVVPSIVPNFFTPGCRVNYACTVNISTEGMFNTRDRLQIH
jgi:hypothetical protein